MADRHESDSAFEAWASLAARLRGQPVVVQKAILAEVPLTLEAWQARNETWAKRLNDDIARGTLVRPARYAQLCRAEQQRRRGVATPQPGEAAGPDAGPGADGGTGEAPAPGADTAAAGGNATTLVIEETGKGDDFRRDLTGDAVPKRPRPDQPITDGAAGMDNVVEAAREIHKGLSWPPARYAVLWAALQQDPGRSDELWTAEGIRTAQARVEIERGWARRIADDAKLRARWDILVAEVRSR